MSNMSSPLHMMSCGRCRATEFNTYLSRRELLVMCVNCSNVVITIHATGEKEQLEFERALLSMFEHTRGVQ